MLSTDNPMNILVYALATIAVGGYALYRITQYMGDVLYRISRRRNVEVINWKFSLLLALAALCWGLLALFIRFGDGGGTIAAAFQSGLYPYALLVGGIFPSAYVISRVRASGLTLGETLLVVIGNLFKGLAIFTVVFMFMAALGGAGSKSKDSGKR